MIQVLASGKGEGKTKRLIDMANNAVKEADGSIIFIDDDNRHIYDLNYNIRFIDTKDFIMSERNTFIGFLYGIIAQDSDIEQVYIDGLSNVVKGLSFDDLSALSDKLQEISSNHSIDFIISMNCQLNELPENFRKFSVAQ